MKSLKVIGALVGILSTMAVAAPLSATIENNTPVAYFLEQLPNDFEASSGLPSNAKNVVIAKVHFHQMSVVWLGGRHCELCTNDIFGTRLKIVEVLRGEAKADQVFNVLLGKRSDHRKYIVVPKTPDQLDRQYTVMMYMADDGKHRLVAFPISQTEYDKWEKEWHSYDRLMSKPGVRH